MMIFKCPACEMISSTDKELHYRRCPLALRTRLWLLSFKRRSHEVYEVITYRQIVEEYGDRCFYCGGPFEVLDHYVPLKLFGCHLLINVRPCCRSCNDAKGSSEPEGIWFEGCRQEAL